MTNKRPAPKAPSPLSAHERALFEQITKGVRPLRQDTLFHPPARRSPRAQALARQRQAQAEASHYFSDHNPHTAPLADHYPLSDHYPFSDQYQPWLADGPARYLRADISPVELKKLRRGDYPPDLILDLHGLTQQQAKQELGALIAACLREHLNCACVMHGHGKQILKQRVPLWLAQHPHIQAFHQAPKPWGGDAALLVLVDINDLTEDRDL